MFRYLNEELETLSRAQITELQNKRLKEIVVHTAKNSPWSAARYKAAGIDPANFRAYSPEERRNKAISLVYDPGSTMKAVTVAAAPVVVTAAYLS